MGVQMTAGAKKVQGNPKAFDNRGVEKPPSCLFWNMAEKNCDGVSVQIKSTMFRKWDQLLSHLATKVGCGGGVRALYSPSGKQYKEISELTDGLDVVVCGTGIMFKQSDIPLKLQAKVTKT
uniref:Ubiquitin-like protein n=1 Tax=Coptotermes formosanus TaxID=36987 RepID=R4UWA9_COPFO|nr:ubiquitin-like protein [Coptotermes formosanus]